MALQQPTRWSWDGASGVLVAFLPAASNARAEACARTRTGRDAARTCGREALAPLVARSLPEREDGRPWLLDGEVALDARVVPAGNAAARHATLASAHGGLRNSAPRAATSSVTAIWRSMPSSTRNAFPRSWARASTTMGASTRVATGWDAFAPLSGEVKVSTDELTWMELFSPDIVEPTGKLDADLRLAGTAPRRWSAARATCAGFRHRTASLGIALHEGDLRMQAQPDGNARIVVRVRSGDGVLNVDGTWAGGTRTRRWC